MTTTELVIEFLKRAFYRPVEEADEAERMRRMQVVCRVAQQLRTHPFGNKDGNLIVIGRRDFGLTQYQVKLCRSRAADQQPVVKLLKAA